MWHMGPYYGGWWMPLMGFLFLAAVIALIVWAARGTSRQDHGDRGGDSRSVALEILKQRYARGEISREEYLRMRDDLLH